jgi:leucyl aminopeptidase
MTEPLKLSFGKPAAPGAGVLLVMTREGLDFGPVTSGVLGAAMDAVKAAAAADAFTGKAGSALELVAPAGLSVSRLIVVGTGKAPDKDKADAPDRVKLGGQLLGRVPAKAAQVMVVLEQGADALDAEAAADVALGMMLRAYRFDRYKTKRKEGEDEPVSPKVTLGVVDAAGARRAWKAREAVATGVTTARDLVNEPPNVLNPVEFARRAAELKGVGLQIDVLDMRQLKRLGMNALLGVGQGSVNESRVVVMRWNGGKTGEPPVAFIGKGVCFDTGGISIKPAAGMEDMKGDMAGAACVTGLMQALAMRKAKVNVIGAIGLVENMPDGNAQRPGDIVRSMSGQTIEIINTDAEGRLVLADVLHYINGKYKPKFMIDLATLTGAIMVALGQEYAGLFSNDDDLSDHLAKAGKATGERVWRMPLGTEYDKMIDSKFADMKNTGGRFAGSITAAQFLQRFVGKTPWVHLDIAGTAMGSPQTDISRGWASGWGVRLLDRLVSDAYER